MLINANSNTNRTKLLQNKYLELLNSGIEAEKILVIVQNSKKKKEFIDEIKENSNKGFIGSLKIYSFWGFIREYILENWVLVEEGLKDKNAKITPYLSGLEISQYIFKKSIDEVDFTGYNSKTSLLHQLFRRNSLINLNNLSKEEIDKRDKILQQTYSSEANQTINKYKAKTIDLRAFDYVRQINIFEYLYKKLENKFEYIFVDDADEITPCVLAYLEHIKPSVKEFFIGYDQFGSSRLGYLGAINVDFEKFLNCKALKPFEDDEKTKNALKIFHSVKEDKKIDVENINTKTFLKRNEMLDCVIEDIKTLVNNGVKPSDIAIITPINDEFLKTTLEKTGFCFNFISKSEKLNQNKIIGYLLELLKIIIDTNNKFVSPYILKGILIEILNIEKKEALSFVQEYKTGYEFQGLNLFDLIKNKDNEQFRKFINIYEKCRFEKLSSILFEIVSGFIPFQKEFSKDIIKINQLLKQICDFEDVFKDEFDRLELIVQLENTIISENPLSDLEIDENSIIVSSAQKIIDYSYKTKYQFLLDVSSENWIRQDIGPLYNSWVMQKKWEKDTFELEDNINLTKDKISRMLYKLYLLADKLTLYSSAYDYLGAENFSGIDKYFEYKNEFLQDTKAEIKPIVPRDDQKEVLKYKGGLMSVSATAGSGKTTIMLLLVDKILSGEILNDIEPNNIFVLTFMESAARNFKERIKAKYPNLKELPNISTIHGLALRILKENNNFSKVGLDYDFEILDEVKRVNILTEIVHKFLGSVDKLDLYDAAISSYKNELVLYGDFECSNKLFLKIYNAYDEKLKSENLIDYDDLLLLSLKLLGENKDILDYYADLAKIIIEDEAQDSSAVQQNLITLLGSKHKNIIRCGDINQAITSTFTNSDVEGFKDFMKKSKNVVMDRCQRCATGVLDCANDTVDYAKKEEINAFSDLIMKPVEGKNIIDSKAVGSFIFETEKEENNFVLKEIQSLLKNSDKPISIAILTRSNFAINKWVKILEEANIRTYKNSDNLINNLCYRISLLILEFIINPYELRTLKEIAKELYDIGFYDFDTLRYANSLCEPIFLRDDFDEQFWWDMNYFLFKNYYSIYDLVCEIGEFYFSKTGEKDNIHMVATIAQKVKNSQKTFEDAVLRLREIQFKNNFSNIKFFKSENKDKRKNTVSVMTIHKSKGDEFDYVFIPELTKDNLCLSIDDCKLKEKSTFIQKIKKYPKDDFELKKEITEENFRLIYVGITRAIKKLYLTVSNNYKFFARDKKFENSEFFEGVLCKK